MTTRQKMHGALRDLRARGYFAYMASRPLPWPESYIIGYADERYALVDHTDDVDPIIVSEALLRHGLASTSKRVVPVGDWITADAHKPWWLVAVRDEERADAA